MRFRVCLPVFCIISLLFLMNTGALAQDQPKFQIFGGKTNSQSQYMLWLCAGAGTTFMHGQYDSEERDHHRGPIYWSGNIGAYASFDRKYIYGLRRFGMVSFPTSYTDHTKSASDISFVVGIIKEIEWRKFILTAGPSVNYMTRQTMLDTPGQQSYEEKKISTYGLTIEGQLLVAPSSSFGGSFTILSNINKEDIYVGLIFNICIGNF